MLPEYAMPDLDVTPASRNIGDGAGMENSHLTRVAMNRADYGLNLEKRFSLETSLTMMMAKNRMSMTTATW